MSQSSSSAARAQAAAVRTSDAGRPGTAASDAANAGTPAGVAAATPAATGATAGTASAHTTKRSVLSAEGLLAAIGAFVIWGGFPIYLKPLHDVPSLQIIAHRVGWACVLVVVWLAARRELRDLRKPLTNPKVLGWLTLSALLITINWLAFVWGVGHGHVVETSLGYFINPLVNVLLGVVILRERLTPAQWTSVGIATAAVLYLAIATGSPPWISLIIAVSFSVYGFLRKVIHVEALQGLAVETLLLMPIAVGYLVWCEATGTGALGHSGFVVDALLVGSGAITAVPLFLFAFAARQIPYSTLGLLLYIAPSLQLLSGIFLYHEPFAGVRAQGFALIWLALAIYAGDGLWRARKAAA
jgi:chloramphenicol-sensitive protein RarD